MARFFFDHHDANGIFKDDVGDELTTAAIARMVALKTVGEVVRDLTSRTLKDALRLTSETARNPSSGLGGSRNDVPQRVRRGSRERLENARLAATEKFARVLPIGAN